MPSTYSQLLRVELQAVGENETTWGDITNSNLSTVLEQAIAGKADIVLNDADHTLTQRYGQADEARQAILLVSGTITAVRSVIIPRLSKHYIVRNLTTGGHEIEIKTSAGAGTKIANGKAKLIFCDGTNVLDASGGTVDAGVVSPSSLTSEDASWVFQGFVGVNRSNAVDPNYGVFAADGPLGSYSAWYANGQLVGQAAAKTNGFTISASVTNLYFNTGGINRVTITTSGSFQTHYLLQAFGGLYVEDDSNFKGSLHGTFADFSGEVEANSFRAKGTAPTIFMQEMDFSTRTFHMNGGNVGITSTVNGWTFYSQNNGNAWIGGTLTQASDERLKKNWASLPEDFVERMAGLKRGTYDRIDTGVRQAGVSAQEVEKILPEVVLTDDQGFKSVAYGNAALVLAVELAALVKAQQQEIKELKERMAALEQP